MNDLKKQLLLKIKSRGDGWTFEELRGYFAATRIGIRKSELDIALLRLIKEGKVWVHRGRYFSKTQYERAVQR